jgi:hypothetical protein
MFYVQVFGLLLRDVRLQPTAPEPQLHLDQPLQAWPSMRAVGGPCYLGDDRRLRCLTFPGPTVEPVDMVCTDRCDVFLGGKNHMLCSFMLQARQLRG